MHVTVKRAAGGVQSSRVSERMVTVLTGMSTSMPRRAKSYMRLPFTLTAENAGGRCSMVPRNRSSWACTMVALIPDGSVRVTTSPSRS